MDAPLCEGAEGDHRARAEDDRHGRADDGHLPRGVFRGRHDAVHSAASALDGCLAMASVRSAVRQMVRRPDATNAGCPGAAAARARRRLRAAAVPMPAAVYPIAAAGRHHGGRVCGDFCDRPSWL
jgi:hypothetical protein